MTVRFKTGSAITAILAVAGVALSVAPAGAADLGGDCCADLEERIAELEATTARKGNRKVKLEVSGHVNEALIFWDDGEEQNVGVYTNDNSRTRFRFKGSAKISDDWKAGYLLEIGVRSARSNRFDQDNPRGETELDVRHSTWYIESKQLGQVWVGRTGPAAEGITEINLAHTKDVAKIADVEDSGLGLFIRSNNGDLTNLSFRRLINDSGDQPGESERGQIVKYVTPEFAGFAVTAAWGGDDYWDVGLNYKGEFAGFKIAGGIAYGEESSSNGDANVIDSCLAAAPGTDQDADCRQLGGSISIMHEATGLYTTFGAGWREDENIGRAGVFDGGLAAADEDSTFWAIEAGIEQKFIPLGKTTIFGQYYSLDGGSNDLRDLNDQGAVCSQDTDPGVAVAINSCAIAGTELEMYGGGVVQAIDSAAMLLYVYYRHYEGDVDVVGSGAGGLTVQGAAIATDGFEDLDVVVAGGLIKF